MAYFKTRVLKQNQARDKASHDYIPSYDEPIDMHYTVLRRDKTLLYIHKIYFFISQASNKSNDTLTKSHDNSD